MRSTPIQMCDLPIQEDPLSLLRGCLCEMPGPTAWLRILQVLEWCPDELQETAVSYAEEHLEPWPLELRSFPLSQPELWATSKLRWLSLCLHVDVPSDILLKPVLLAPIEELPWSEHWTEEGPRSKERIWRAIESADVRFVAELARFTAQEFLNHKNVGRTALKVCGDVLGAVDLQFRMSELRAVSRELLLQIHRHRERWDVLLGSCYQWRLESHKCYPLFRSLFTNDLEGFSGVGLLRLLGQWPEEHRALAVAEAAKSLAWHSDSMTPFHNWDGYLTEMLAEELWGGGNRREVQEAQRALRELRREYQRIKQSVGG